MDKKELVIILALTFIVVMIWVASDIIHSKPSEPLDPKIQKLIEPIDPNFDTNLIEELRK